MELRPVAYRTLATRIRDAIRNGEYADGRQLPTEEQLAASYSVSRQTVRRAMQDLVSEGIIYRVAGRGTYPVAEQDRYVNHFGSVEELMALSLDTECEVVSPLQRKVDVETASRLRLPSDEIYTVTLVRRHADVPVLLHLGLPAAADRAAADRVRRAGRGGPSQPGDRHRADRRAAGRGRSPRPSRASARPAPPRSPPGTSAARPASRCCGSTGCTSTPRTPRSSSPSATSTPSTTPTASSSAAVRASARPGTVAIAAASAAAMARWTRA